MNNQIIEVEIKDYDLVVEAQKIEEQILNKVEMLAKELIMCRSAYV